MSRRTAAGLLALGLVVVLGIAALTRPVGYVKFSPGPTLNVLGKYDGKPIVTVKGHPSYKDDGALRMVTVYESGPNENIGLFSTLYGWANPDIAVLPKSAVYQPDETDDTSRQESAVEMTSSQDSATAAALHALGVSYRTQVEVAAVNADGASVGKLKKGDVLLAVDGKAASTAEGLVKLIRALKPGTATTLSLRRDRSLQQVTVKTKADPEDPKASRIGVSIREDFVFPFTVKLTIPSSIGGPSAGMIFALSIYDLLTPGSLTGGKQVAGTGTIDADGTVGPIGGITQKIPAAQRDGAKLFLVAAENCAEALNSHYDSDRMRLVKVHTLADAIRDVETWREDPRATLPRCTR